MIEYAGLRSHDSCAGFRSAGQCVGTLAGRHLSGGRVGLGALGLSYQELMGLAMAREDTRAVSAV